jgi:hypothetical protein
MTGTKKLVIIAPIAFCLMMLFDWTGLTGRHFPSSWIEALIQICINIVWTTIIMVVSYFVMVRPLQQSPSEKDTHDLAQGAAQQQTDGEPRSKPKP